MDKECNALIGRVKAGDDAAFCELCEKYRLLIENVVRHFAPSLGFEKSGYDVRSDALRQQTEAAEDLEDLKQDARMALYKAAKSYDPEGDGKKVSFGLYAKICMNNAMITKVRKYKRTVKRLQKQSHLSAEFRKTRAKADLPEERVDFAALSDTLRQAVDGLSDLERQVLARYMDGKTVREIARELDRTPKSVSNARYRLKAKLKQVLKQ